MTIQELTRPLLVNPEQQEAATGALPVEMTVLQVEQAVQDCSICLLPLSEGEIIEFHPNDVPHEFHVACLESYEEIGENSKACPLCRAPGDPLASRKSFIRRICSCNCFVGAFVSIFCIVVTGLFVGLIYSNIQASIISSQTP